MRKTNRASKTGEPRPDPKAFVFQKEKLAFPLTIRDFPWSDKQREFIKLAEDKTTKILLVKGPAGTAKTMLAVHAALNALNDKKIGELIYIRNPCESSSFSLGFLKGGMDEKLGPYLAPLEDKLAELLPTNEIQKLRKDERLIGMPLGFLRGRTFSVANVIVDEAQNLQYQDLLLIMTRMGKFSKLFLCGDTMQSDIRQSSFQTVFDLFDDEFSKSKGIHTFEFTTEDIFRSDVLAFIIEKFDTLKNGVK